MTSFADSTFSKAQKLRISEAYLKSVRPGISRILTGHCLVVDPSSGGSSLPAFAVLRKGVVTEVAEIPISAVYRGRSSMIGHRLAEIGQFLRRKFRKPLDLLAVELIHATPHSTTNFAAFQALNMGIGAIHAGIVCPYRIVIPPWDWHARRPPGYEKSDIGDVTLLAQTLLEDARRLSGLSSDSTAPEDSEA